MNNLSIEEQLHLAKDVAHMAHDGQTRRDRTTPYIRHVEDVVQRCDDPTEKVVAWLHDVIEDSGHSVDSLLNLGFSFEVVGAVDSVTKKEGESYHNFVARARRNIVGRSVKLHDIMSNLCDDPTKRQIVKYAKALITLVG